MEIDPFIAVFTNQNLVRLITKKNKYVHSKLISFDTLHLKPVKGEFDINTAENEIKIIGSKLSLFPHKIETRGVILYLIFLEKESLLSFQAKRERSPTCGFPFVLVIELSKLQIVIYSEYCSSEDLPFAREFLGYLIGHHKCTGNWQDGGIVDHLLPHRK